MPVEKHLDQQFRVIRTLPQRSAIRVDGSTYHNMLLQDSSGDPSVPHLARLHPVHDIDLI